MYSLTTIRSLLGYVSKDQVRDKAESKKDKATDEARQIDVTAQLEELSSDLATNQLEGKGTGNGNNNRDRKK